MNPSEIFIKRPIATSLLMAAIAMFGIVAYHAAGKARDLGVPAELLMQHGEVSEPVARAMAEGCRQRFDADYALSITGIAGPTGGTPEKPVGAVWIALADRNAPTVANLHRFSGDRSSIRDRSAQTALNTLRLRLISLAADARR